MEEIIIAIFMAHMNLGVVSLSLVNQPAGGPPTSENNPPIRPMHLPLLLLISTPANV